MRFTTAIAAGLLAAGPMIAFTQPAHSQQNDLMGQAQRFFNNNNNNDQNSRDAYQRGRDDEMRRQQAERDRSYSRDRDPRVGDRDVSRDGRYRGQDRETLLANLRTLRSSGAVEATPRKPKRRKAKPTLEPAGPQAIGAAAALHDMSSPDLAETVGRYWVSPVPLPPRPPALVTDVDLVLRQLPAPDPALGGAELSERLRALYATFRPAP